MVPYVGAALFWMEFCIILFAFSLRQKKPKQSVAIMHLSMAAFCVAFDERVHYRGNAKRPTLARSALNRGRKFKSLFGLSIAKLWNALDRYNDMSGWHPTHLLDALYFLKVYPTESVHAAFAGKDEKTLRKWNWKVIEAIAELPCVSY